MICIQKIWILLLKVKDLKKTSGKISGIRSLKEFNEKLQITTSHAIEDSVPGKSLKWMIVEKNTNTILGFCRFGSPTINSKPRNDWLGTTPDLGIFNRRASWDLLLFQLNHLDTIILVVSYWICCVAHMRSEIY